MNFLEALKEGKKIRRSNWYKLSYLKANYLGYLENQNEADVNLIVPDYLATDWEIFKEENEE